MNEQSPTYRVRYRFRLQKKLHVSEKEKRILVDGREVVISSQNTDRQIQDDEWLVMNARGFESEPAARQFGERLKAASELTSVVARLGINSGLDRPTAGLGQAVKDEYARTGLLPRDNVHGIDVFPDTPNVRIVSFTAIGTVYSAPDPFLSELNALHKAVLSASQQVRDIVLLLNYALTCVDPVAQIVFAVSAVEMLGQQEDWSDRQRELLAHLASIATELDIGTDEERDEVAAAITRGMQKLSLRQGVLRLLHSLGLGELRKTWDDLYSARSTLVHGLAPTPGVDYGPLAFRTMSLCGRILLTLIAREIEGADKYLGEMYPLD